ncbi:50 kDa gamma-zein-like [Haliotis rubra]|uniref:50 kDa gamma-zein-like n=1 Tax=Haliotis rubra TaxID=36100 RepID=UPI001EE55DDE|nr:50 kDa gamma-zein-like [Haliotis rubra]
MEDWEAELFSMASEGARVESLLPTRRELGFRADVGGSISTIATITIPIIISVSCMAVSSMPGCLPVYANGTIDYNGDQKRPHHHQQQRRRRPPDHDQQRQQHHRTPPRKKHTHGDDNHEPPRRRSQPRIKEKTRRRRNHRKKQKKKKKKKKNPTASPSPMRDTEDGEQHRGKEKPTRHRSCRSSWPS